MSGESIKRKTQGEAIVINQSLVLAGTSQAHYSRHTLSPTGLLLLLLLPLVSPASHPIKPSSTLRGSHGALESRKACHAPCLADCCTPISWLRRAECTNPQDADGPHMSKRCFLPSFSAVTPNMASHATAVNALLICCGSSYGFIESECTSLFLGCKTWLSWITCYVML